MSSLPSHLSTDSAQGLSLSQPIAQFEIGDYRNFIYLVLDWSSRRAAIVDPQSDLSAPLGALEQEGFELAFILLTHTHHDHIAGVPELARLRPHAPIVLNQADAHRLDRKLGASQRLQLVTDGDRLSLGALGIEVLHTPGHSAGECCYLVHGADRPYLLTGDTVFIRDCGRTDLESGSTREMFSSLQRIARLPPDTVILPGHHYKTETASTLDRELRESAPFRCQSVEELEALP